MRRSTLSQQAEEPSVQDQKLDEEFIKTMLEVEKHYSSFNKHDKIRIEQWSKKLCQVTLNSTWKQNRNNYALLLLNCVTSGSLIEPFNKVPPEDALPSLNTHIVKKRINSVDKKLPQKNDSSRKSLKMKKEDSDPPKPLIQMYTPTKMEEPLQNFQNTIETKRSTQRMMKNSESRNSIAHSEGYALMNKSRYSNKENTNTKTYEHENYLGKSTNNEREVKKLTAQMELVKLSNESLQNDINIKNVTISQLNKKVDLLTRTNMQQQTERNNMMELLKFIKRGIDDHSITFSNKSLGNNFLLQFSEVCQQSGSENTYGTLPSYSSNQNQTRAFIGGSPHRPTMESPATHPIVALTNLSNFDSNDKRLRTSSDTMMTDLINFKNLSMHRQKEDLSLEDTNSLLSKRSKTPSLLQGVKSPHTNRTNYEEAKQLLQHTDRDTADFLDYLERFQKENERLRKETEELLLKS